MHNVVAIEGAHRNRDQLGNSERFGQDQEIAPMLIKNLLREPNQIHFVDRCNHRGNAEQGGNARMAARLVQDAFAGIDQHYRNVRRRGSRGHIARVLLVAWGIGDDEFPFQRGEVPVGHVNRDALFPLGAQSVGELCEIDPGVAGDRCNVIVIYVVGVVEESADECRLAVVDAAGRGEPEQFLPALGGEECIDTLIRDIGEGRVREWQRTALCSHQK
jgi:hypothetical protein